MDMQLAPLADDGVVRRGHYGYVTLDDLDCEYRSKVDDLGGAERIEHSSSSMLEHGSSPDDKRLEHSSSSMLEHVSNIDDRTSTARGLSTAQTLT
jgi:hypothetical protein